MKDIEKTNFVDFPKCPDGQHIAKLVGIFDLGTQPVVYEGKTKMSPRIYLQFEVYAELEDGTYAKDQDGHFFMVGIEYTASLSNRSKLLPFINSWRGKPLEDQDFPFRFSRMLGKYALLSVVNNENKDDPRKKYTNIVGISGAPKKMMEGIPEGMIEPFFFDLDAEDWEVMSKFFDSGRLWERIKGRIASSPEYMERMKGKKNKIDMVDGGLDDIPF